MVDVSQKDSEGVPGIPTAIEYHKAIRIGEGLPDITLGIKNGADQVVFTDAQGNSVTGCARRADQTPLPPCDLQVQLYNSSNFFFAGVIGGGVQPGTYVFYVRAHNASGWGNICTCKVRIAL